MNELFQITAEYSNAVLVAILPYFSDFAHKLELPVPAPIALAHAYRFSCDPRRDQFGGWLILKNGFEFWFENGYVRGFSSPKSYADLQDPALIPKFYGQPRIDRTQALALARDSLKKLGYDLKSLYADLEPRDIMDPEHIGTNIVPYYRFEWENPLREAAAVDIEINAATKTVERLKLWNDTLWRAPPKTSVSPSLVGPQPLHRDPAISNALVRAMLPELSRFAKRMDLPFTLPLTTNHVERAEFSPDAGTCHVKLTNGYWLIYELEHARGFFAPNSFYKRWFRERCQSIEEYLGKWNIDEREAIEIARKAIRKAGYTDAQFETSKVPETRKPKQVGPYLIPRYLFEWRVWDPKHEGATFAEASVEVDGDTGAIKYLYLLDMRIKPGEYE